MKRTCSAWAASASATSVRVRGPSDRQGGRHVADENDLRTAELRPDGGDSSNDGRVLSCERAAGIVASALDDDQTRTQGRRQPGHLPDEGTAAVLARAQVAGTGFGADDHRPAQFRGQAVRVVATGTARPQPAV